jgi:Dual specificity phosphatase, catalytic domain
MTFTIANMIYPCLNDLEKDHITKCNQITKGVDLALIVAISIVSGLILGDVLKLDLPVGVGNYIAYGILGGGGLIIVADVITSFCPRREPSFNLEQTKEEYHTLIVDTKPVERTSKMKTDSLYTPCEEILPWLFLGNATAFAETTHLTCTHFPRGKKQDVKSSNPREFTTVITVCKLTDIVEGIIFAKTASLPALKEQFKEKEIHWYPVGRNFTDKAENWASLVYDCTHLNSNQDALGIYADNYDRLLNDVHKPVLKRPVTEWFHGIFTVLDRAMQSGEKVLVHCQAGISRSPTLIAAYLINRYHVTAEQAINFLKSKRAVVDPNFTDQLKDYETRLLELRCAQEP